MDLIDEIKHNLQIGAPRLRTVKKLHAHNGAAPLALNLNLNGGKEGTHVSVITVRLQTVQADTHGHAAYAVHTIQTETNGDAGWNINPKERVNLTIMFDPGNPPQTEQPMLIDVTAETGRGVNNPRAVIELTVGRTGTAFLPGEPVRDDT